MNDPKYHVGQVVRVEHKYEGSWTGTITHLANAGDDETGDAWEYEVSDAPSDRLVENPPSMSDFYAKPGNRWHPLVWEAEIVEALS